jgi:hypothetical protein
VKRRGSMKGSRKKGRRTMKASEKERKFLKGNR